MHGIWLEDLRCLLRLAFDRRLLASKQALVQSVARQAEDVRFGMVISCAVPTILFQGLPKIPAHRIAIWWANNSLVARLVVARRTTSST